MAVVKFEEISEDWEENEQFWDRVVKAPILVSAALSFCMPQLATTAIVGIPFTQVIAAVAIGIGFGAAHYSNYKSGGKQVVGIGSVSGSIYGIVQASFGIHASIAAHMVHNFSAAWLDKQHPAFLRGN